MIIYTGNVTSVCFKRVLFRSSQRKEVSLMTPWEYILGAVLIIISLILIVIVLMQQSKSQGLSGAIAGGAETFFGKHKGRTIEAKLEKLTKILCTAFIILTLATTLVVGFLA